MKKWLILSALLLAFQTNAKAIDLDSYVDYTGNEVGKAADFISIEANTFTNTGLGGAVANDFVQEKAYEFTVSHPLTISDLSINAQQVPSNSFSPNDPLYNTPQSMNVSFQLYQGTQPWGPGQFPAPGQQVLSSNYTFTTSDGHTTQSFSNVQVPFNTELKPGNNYWIAAQDPQWGQGSTLNYSTEFMGKVANPEPATWLFFGMLILLVFFKGYNSRNNSV